MSKRNRNKNPWPSRRPSTPAAAAAGPRPSHAAQSSGTSLLVNRSVETPPTPVAIVLAHEDAASYENLLAGLMRTYRPEDESEKLLVRQAADAQWLILRAARLEAALMTLIAAGEDAKPATPDQRIAAYMLSKPGDALAKVLRYRTTAERSFYRAIKELERLADFRAQLEEIAATSTPNQFVSQNADSAPQFVSQNAQAQPAPAPDTPSLCDAAAA